MADDLAKLWGKFSLTEEEGSGVEAPEDTLDAFLLKGHTCLVGKLLADRIVGKDTIKSTLIRGWKPTGFVLFKVIGPNLFLVEFEFSWDLSRVLEGRPWDFEGNLFAVEEFDGVTPPTQMKFDTAEFWVRMYDLPLACMGTVMGFKLGAAVGRVEEVDTNEEGVGWGEYLRVRIHVNLRKPLVRGRMLKIRDRTTWISFQYEKIPRFCFKCGVIAHDQEGCLLRGSRKIYDKEVDEQFGPWLRVGSPRRWMDRRRDRRGGNFAESEGRVPHWRNVGHTGSSSYRQSDDEVQKDPTGSSTHMLLGGTKNGAGNHDAIHAEAFHATVSMQRGTIEGHATVPWRPTGLGKKSPTLAQQGGCTLSLKATEGVGDFGEPFLDSACGGNCCNRGTKIN
jgi:hypothetical protein